MLHIDEITDKNRWQHFLEKTYTVSYPFFQSWEWGEVLESLSISVERIGLFDGGTLVGVVMIADIKAKRGHYLYLRQGPVLITFTKEYFSEILEYVKKRAKEYGASFIRISRLLKDEQLSPDFFNGFGFRMSKLQIIDAEVTPLLDITKSEDELLKQMRKSHRYLIKKAKALPIEIITSTDKKDLEVFLNLLHGLSKRKHFVVHHEIEKEFDVFTKYNECVLFSAKYEGKIIAGAFIDFVGNMMIYRHAASDSAYKNIPVSYLIQWEAIREGKRRGKAIYNFMGIAPEHAKKNHPWQGFSLFKTGFGGNMEYYFPTMDLPLNYKYWKNYMIDLMTKVRKGY